MRSPRFLFLACALPLFVPLGLQRGPADDADQDELVTLLAGDELSSSFDFRMGRSGATLVAGEVQLVEAQIVYDAFASDRISFGFARDERVEVLDLGGVLVMPRKRAGDLALKFPIAAFHTLQRRGASFYASGPGEDLHALPQADRILARSPEEGLRHVEPHLGHTYLVRARSEGVGGVDELFKFLVVGHLPGHSVTLRWDRVPER